MVFCRAPKASHASSCASGTARRTRASATCPSRCGNDASRRRRASRSHPGSAPRGPGRRGGRARASPPRGDQPLLAQLDPPERGLRRDPRPRSRDRRQGGRRGDDELAGGGRRAPRAPRRRRARPRPQASLRGLVESDTHTGSGYAEDLSMRTDALFPERVAARAAEKCALDRDRRQLAPGDYEAVFEELAVAEILRIVSITGLGAQSVKEGRSFMSGRIDDRVTGDDFTLWDDAHDARTLGIPFDVEGTLKRKVTLVENGVARGPVYDRASAKAMGARSTGHAADPLRYTPGGHAGNLTMAGGAATREELIGAVGRGLLITRFHYTNTPDPRAATMTGTTRDGTFLIEDGKITAALANLRYTMSALDLFAGIELLGPQRLARDWWSSNGMGSVVCLVPPLKVRRATITGSSPL